MNKIAQFLKDSGTFYLATVEGGQPRVRPFGAVLEYEGKIYLCTSNQKDVYRQIMANPKVEVSGMVGQDQWIRLSGELVRDERREVKEAMLESMPSLKNIYSLDDGVFELLYFSSGQAAFCSYTTEPKIINI